MNDPQPLLSIRNMTVRFGGLTAINTLDLDIARGHIVAVVGPNGAGKTTVLNCISGFVQPESGTIVFNGTDLGALPRHRRAALGIVRTFQNLQLFASMTVLDNLMAAQHTRLHASLLSALLPVGPAVREDRLARERARAILSLMGLEQWANVPAGSLPFGLQQMTSVARALVLQPKLLLLDEPAAGTPHRDVETLANSVRRWRTELDITIVLIEHNMHLVQAAADVVSVLDYGRKLAEGTPGDVLRNPTVLEAYLGTSTGETETLHVES